jgi:Fic family protein
VKPSLYLSDFFERNRASYYDTLIQMRTSDDIVHWVRFFLNGVAETAERGRDTIRKILALRMELEAQLSGMGRRATNARHLLNLLFRRPVISAKDLVGQLEMSAPTANVLVGEFEKKGILREVTAYQRNRVFVFERYLRLFLI